MIVNVHEAKSTLSKLLKAALEGEEVIIAKAGRPLVRLEPVSIKQESVPGRFAGQIQMDNFFEPLIEEELAAWEN